jgi:hypothetical protein
MKKTYLLCMAVSAALILGGCTNQNPTANSSQHGLVGPGSVAPVSGGPAHPGHVPQKYQP